MHKRTFWALALALLMLAAALAGCTGKKQDLPVVTGAPTQEAAATAEPTQDFNLITSAPTEDATEAPTEEATEAPTAVPTEAPTPAPTQSPVSEDGKYFSKDEVALYIHLYGHLPSNFITKNEARKLGWTGGKLEPYAPGCAIGGDHFGNYEGLLPTAQGRKYTECDIDTKGKPRGAKRIIFSNDGLIYYTADHYETFTLLYGGD